MSGDPFQHVADIAKGYQNAQILFTAVRLDLFTTLGDEQKSARRLADELRCSERGISVLCDALTALGLLRKLDGRYLAEAGYRELLSAESPDHYLGMLRHRAALYDKWRGLSRAVQSGTGVGQEWIDPALQGTVADFAYAMKDAARNMADKVAGLLELSPYQTLLDVGGGPGMYAVEFLRAHPHLTVTILDNSETLEVACRTAEREGLLGHIKLRAGDILKQPPSEHFDVVFSSNVIHTYSVEDNARLVRNCAELLRPGGMVVVKDFVLRADRTAPPEAAIFAVNMLVNTPGGNCYTSEEIEEWYRGAGLVDLEWIEIDAANKMLLGRRG